MTHHDYSNDDAAGWVVREGENGEFVLNGNMDYDTLSGSVNQIVPVLEVHPQGYGQVEIIFNPVYKMHQRVFGIFRDITVKSYIKVAHNVRRCPDPRSFCSVP